MAKQRAESASTPSRRSREQSLAPAREFSTRFLPSDGIPAYNALLDGHLGKRREFLLGNRQSLTLLQQTGVIGRVETQPENPNQYVVHMADKPIHRRKRLPPRASTGSLEPPWRQNSSYASPSDQHSRGLRGGSASTPQLAKSNDGAPSAGSSKMSPSVRAQIASLKGLGKSRSTGTVLTATRRPVLESSAASRLTLLDSTKCPALPENLSSSSSHETEGGDSSTKATKLLPPTSNSSSATRHRSRSVVPSMMSSPSVTELQPRGSASRKATSTALTTTAAHSTVKGTVEHLLESDAAFMAQIRTMKEQLAELEATKARLDTETGRLRRKLRGVNAVRENDVAVAHCSSIMQHRLSKAEEEYMKLVTQQQEVKKDVDRMRRELLSLRKVRHKLQTDIEEVAQANAGFEEKIHAAKVVRNQVSEELSELERRAEVELEEQRLNLPPEDAVVVDVAKLMGAVQERKTARRNASMEGGVGSGAIGLNSIGGKLSTLQLCGTTSSTAPNNSGKSSRPQMNRQRSMRDGPKPLLDYCTAFRVIQNSLGCPDVESFAEQFTTTEEQLLSKYKANLALADELASLQKEHNTLTSEKIAKRASVRGTMQASEQVERAMQARIQTALTRIRSYNELREQRNREHTRLRGIMLRCLEALHIDSGLSENDDGGNSSTTSGGGSRKGTGGGRAMHVSELPSPALLETLQRKMTQVAVALKVKHSSRILELPPEALRLSRSQDGRRSNMFSTREASKIVLGPREPSGSALAAILGTAQPPSVEAAMALTESLSLTDVMHGFHRGRTSSGRRRASRRPIGGSPSPVKVTLDVPVNGSIASVSGAGVVGISGAGIRGRSRSRASSSGCAVTSGTSLSSMIEADAEEDGDEEEERNEDEEDEEAPNEDEEEDVDGDEDKDDHEDEEQLEA